MRIGDSSAIYAVFNGDDPHHAAARAAFEDPEPIMIPSEIIVEALDLLAYRTDHTIASTALDALLAKPHISIAPLAPIEGTRGVHQESGGRLSLADAVVVQTCRMWGCRPLTFDREIERLAG